MFGGCDGCDGLVYVECDESTKVGTSWLGIVSPEAAKIMTPATERWVTWVAIKTDTTS